MDIKKQQQQQQQQQTTKQNKTKQKTKQNKTKQNKTKQTKKGIEEIFHNFSASKAISLTRRFYPIGTFFGILDLHSSRLW